MPYQHFIQRTGRRVRGVIDPNDYPFAYIANAAFADLTKWIDFNQPPPHAHQIETTSSIPPTMVFDQFGNALGGVRTPFVDVPTASYTPTDTVRTPRSFPDSASRTGTTRRSGTSRGTHCTAITLNMLARYSSTATRWLPKVSGWRQMLKQQCKKHSMPMFCSGGR